MPFFDLISRDNKTKISVPKANVARVGVRKLVTEEELEEHMEAWVPDVKTSKLHHKNRKSRFEQMRQTGSFTDIGSVIVTIHYLINKAKATFEEKRMYDQIRKRLINEIEIVKDMDPTKSESLLGGALDIAITREPPPDLEDEEEAAAAAAAAAAEASGDDATGDEETGDEETAAEATTAEATAAEATVAVQE